MKTVSLSFACLALAMLVSSPAWAGIAFKSGGVGESSRTEMEAVQNNYSLKVVFTGEGGMYLSDVNVSVLDRSGAEIFSTITEGPFLLAELPAGTYTLNVESNGHKATRKTSVSDIKTLKTIHIYLPIKDESLLNLRDRLENRGMTVTMIMMD